MESKRVPLETTTPDASPAPPAADAAPTGEATPQPELDLSQIDQLKKKIVATLQTCYDPEIPVNIHELGLIYDIEIGPTGAVGVRMTLTSPACPAAGSLPPEVKAKVAAVPGVTSAKLDIVWDPPWNQSMMSDEAKLQLGIFDY